jgi:NAD(P)H-nitrite reductase large subunit
LASAPAIAVDLAGKVAGSLGARPNPRFEPVRRPAPLLFMMDEGAAAALIAENPAYGHEICHCCHVSEGELVDALHRNLPVLSLDSLKWRTGAMMGPCQGGRCTAKILAVMMRELEVDAADVDKRLPGSKIVVRSGSAAETSIDAFIAADEDEPDCFERSRASYEIPGSRPAGVYSARCALDLLEMSGCAPGREALVYGMGDTALECACALTDAGVHVKAVVDVEDEPVGSDALLQECESRGITLMSGCEVVHIAGANRLEGVTIRRQGLDREIPCDLLVISKGHVRPGSF